MNILVTGANGQLGREMRIISEGTTDTYIFTDIVPAEGLETEILDITDPDAVRRTVKENGIRCIVNCAAYTNVDRAETDEALCRRLNAYAPGILAGAIKNTGGLLIHISTDYVFGAEPYNTPCREEQTGTPTGVYGRTKSSRPELNVVFDQVGTPTYAYDLAQAIMAILEDYTRELYNNTGRGAEASVPSLHHPAFPGARFEPGYVEDGESGYIRTGIYHYSNEGVCSWYDFAKMIAEYSGHAGCVIRPTLYLTRRR